jgi:hypothetical protein
LPFPAGDNVLAVLLAGLLTGTRCPPPLRFTVDARISDREVTGGRGFYRAQARVRYIVRSGKPARSSDPGVIAHERGAVQIARRVEHSSGGMVQANGASRAQALQHLARAIAQMRHDLASELVREESVYDTITQNGMAQDQGPAYGLPGGPDAHVACKEKR